LSNAKFVLFSRQAYFASSLSAASGSAPCGKRENGSMQHPSLLRHLSLAI